MADNNLSGQGEFTGVIVIFSCRRESERCVAVAVDSRNTYNLQQLEAAKLSARNRRAGCLASNRCSPECELGRLAEGKITNLDTQS